MVVELYDHFGVCSLWCCAKFSSSFHLCAVRALYLHEWFPVSVWITSFVPKVAPNDKTSMMPVKFNRHTGVPALFLKPLHRSKRYSSRVFQETVSKQGSRSERFSPANFRTICRQPRRSGSDGSSWVTSNSRVKKYRGSWPSAGCSGAAWQSFSEMLPRLFEGSTAQTGWEDKPLKASDLSLIGL